MYVIQLKNHKFFKPNYGSSYDLEDAKLFKTKRNAEKCLEDLLLGASYPEEYEGASIRRIEMTLLLE